jgi:hypothetical protein
MSNELLTAAEAARRLGIRVTTLYDWLGQSDHGLLRIRGAPFTIDYLQSGPRGQGKIGIDVVEVERIKLAMRAVPLRRVERRLFMQSRIYPGITVPLGRPNA